MMAILLLALSLVYLLFNVTKQIVQNYRGHRFFKTKSPNLPVAPNASLFSGHLFSVIKQRKNYQIITDLHKKYGSTFGLYYGHQPWVMTKDLDLIKLITIDEGHRHVDRPHYSLPFEEFNKSIFQNEGEVWRRIRRSVSPALTNIKVRGEEINTDLQYVLGQAAESIESRVRKAEQLTGKKSIILDAHDTCLRYALAVIFLIALKRDKMVWFHADTCKWTRVMQRGAEAANHPIVTLCVLFPFLRPLFVFLMRLHKAGRMVEISAENILKTVSWNRDARQLNTKGASPETKDEIRLRRHMIDTLVDALLDKRLNYHEFVGTAFFMILAGFQTTADTICCLIWQLAKHPDIQERLRKVIASEGIDAEYLAWCIKETTRWMPPVPLGMGRKLDRDVSLNGVHLPKGTNVISSIHTIHHDSAIWPEADEFKPDRWRDASCFHPAAYIGFGLGPRNCVGGKLAVQEIKLFMQFLLAKYRVEKCPETPEEYKFSSPGLIYTIPDQPIKVRLVEL